MPVGLGVIVIEGVTDCVWLGVLVFVGVDVIVVVVVMVGVGV